MKAQHIEEIGWLYNEDRKVKIGNLVRTLWVDTYNNLYIIIKGKPFQIGYFDGTHSLTNDDLQYKGFELI